VAPDAEGGVAIVLGAGGAAGALATGAGPALVDVSDRVSTAAVLVHRRLLTLALFPMIASVRTVSGVVAASKMIVFIGSITEADRAIPARRRRAPV